MNLTFNTNCILSHKGYDLS